LRDRRRRILDAFYLRITTMTPMQSEESTPGHNDESTPA
jgi:hypothetical protein